MAMSYRPIQAALNGADFTVAQMAALNDARPVILQNFLQGTYSVTSSTTLNNVSAGGTQATGVPAFNLYVQLTESDAVSDGGVWLVEGCLFFTGVLVGIGAKVALAASDGLTFVTAAGAYSQMELNLRNNGAADVSNYGFASTTLTNTVAATAVFNTCYFRGIVQVLGEGALTVQVAQNVSTGTAVTVNPGSWIRAESICALEH